MDIKTEKKNNMYIREFLDYLVLEKGSSKNTASGYERDLKLFFISVGKDVLEVKEDDIYKYIDAKELELLITIAVERMPPQRQRIYKMSREQGMSNDEIAASLCINKRTVENHLTQALADIRKLLSLILIIFF